jgi:hypothetical protein
MEQSPSWEAEQFSQLTKKFPAFYGTRRFFTVAMNHRGDKIKDNGMGWACGSHGGKNSYVQNFGGEIGKESTWKV